MKAASIVNQAAAHGVRLSLSPEGLIKAAGEESAVKRWLPIIRDNKLAIIAELQGLTCVLAWLEHIGETDPEIVADVLNRCRLDPEARAYFLKRAKEVGR